jgi:hypothetical protein
MYCKNCGAAVVGKFCSYCGKKVLTDVQQLNATARKMSKDFCEWAYRESGHMLSHKHLASACWCACEMKYGKGLALFIGDRYVVVPGAYEKLEIVRDHAIALYERLKAETF